MFDYLVKFNKLPKELKDEVSSPLVMAAIDDLEERFKVNLATVIMRVMVQEIAFNDLPVLFTGEFGLSEPMAQQLQTELAARVFLKVADYLGIDMETVLARAEQTGSAPAGQDTTTIESAAAAEPGQVKGAQFFFSADDEEEIRQLSKGIDVTAKAPSLANLDERLNKVLQKAEINFGSEELVNRFKLIVGTYLRDVRNRLDTKLTLTKNFEAGGLGFDTDSAERVLELADKSAELLEEEKAEAPPAAAEPSGQAESLARLKAVGARDIEYDLGKAIKERQDAGASSTPSAAAVSQPSTPAPASSSAKATEDKLEPEPDLQVIRRPTAPASGQTDTAGKVKMEDIKYVPRSMGPIDELKYMDLASFRRLEKEPSGITNKIREKIRLLEDENYAKRLEGVKAWRSSPVNKLYLELGEAAIAKNQPMDIIIEERRAANQDYLSSEEIEAIQNLNRELRF